MRTTLAITLFATLTFAQAQRPIAYPQDTLTGTSGNLVPLGASNSSANFDETRYQMLIPANYLPSPGGPITGIAINTQTYNTSYTYADVTITLSHFQGTTLSGTFANNLPAPQVVLTGPLTVNWVSRTWVVIPFTTPFPYNGTDGLVIQFQKIIDRQQFPPVTLMTMETDGNPGRTDLPNPQANFGTPGSGAATAPTARIAYSTPLRLRVLFDGRPTLLLRSNRGGSNNKVFAIGQNVDSEVHAPAGAAYATFFDTGFQPPVTIPGLQGSLIVSPLSVFASGTVPATEVALTTVTIPPSPFLVGGYVVFQSLVLDPLSGTLAFTNGCDSFIND